MVKNCKKLENQISALEREQEDDRQDKKVLVDAIETIESTTHLKYVEPDDEFRNDPFYYRYGYKQALDREMLNQQALQAKNTPKKK